MQSHEVKCREDCTSLSYVYAYGDGYAVRYCSKTMEEVSLGRRCIPGLTGVNFFIDFGGLFAEIFHAAYVDAKFLNS